MRSPAHQRHRDAANASYDGGPKPRAEYEGFKESAPVLGHGDAKHRTDERTGFLPR